MKLLFLLLGHLLVTLARLTSPGGLRSVVAESLAVKHQLLIVKRSQRRAPNLTSWDRLMLGFYTLLVSPKRLRKMALITKPSTLLRLHHALVKCKYHLLYSAQRPRRPGAQRSLQRADCCGGRDEKAQPTHGLPQDCRANLERIRPRDQQGCRPADTHPALSAGTKRRWPFLALGYRALSLLKIQSEPDLSRIVRIAIESMRLREAAAEGGVLDRLRHLGEDLVRSYDWEAAAATLFVLTGRIPLIQPLVLKFTWSAATFKRRVVELSVDPAVSPAELAKQYGVLRSKLISGQRVRPLSDKHLQLASFLAEKPTESWASRLHRWNKAFPKWKYIHASNFRRDALKARERVVGHVVRELRWSDSE
jgi:hypothetical protein